MACLTSEQVQAVADQQGTAAEREHVASCATCRAALVERQKLIATLEQSVQGIEPPPAAMARIEAALSSGAHVAGATRLRAVTTSRWPHAAWGTGALVAATLIAVLFVAPALKRDRGAVSASEILAQSANQLANVSDGGIELREYDLVLDGVPKEMMPDQANGTYHVRQAIDQRSGGRFRFSSFGPDGQPISSIAQDATGGRRVMAFNLEGQWYRFEVSVGPEVGPSLPELERLHMQATIAMMQASGDQLMEVVETAEGRQYRIEVPRIGAPTGSPLWDLAEARVVIDADDYRVTEFSVRGTFLKRAYSISYRLISRTVVPDVAPDTFEVESHPGEIVISGEGSAIPARDAMVLALRELTRMKQGR